jgi:hypothetical protein
MSNSKVSNAIRNDNKRAIEARAKWRNEYAWLTKEIRNFKRTVSMDSRVAYNLINPQECKDTIYGLKALQTRANEMMLDCYAIKMNLIKTAYRYV